MTTGYKSKFREKAVFKKLTNTADTGDIGRIQEEYRIKEYIGTQKFGTGTVKNSEKGWGETAMLSSLKRPPFPYMAHTQQMTISSI